MEGSEDVGNVINEENSGVEEEEYGGREDTNNIVGDVIEEDISEVAEEGRKEDTNNTDRDAREISSFRRLVDAGLENLAKILQR